MTVNKGAAGTVNSLLNSAVCNKFTKIKVKMEELIHQLSYLE
jgi:hypothetical protein